MSPGLRAALAEEPVRVRGADDRQPVLRLRVADRVAAGERAAGLADLGRRHPRRSPRAPSRGRSSGNAAIESANRTRPPIAKTSDSAFAAAISPNVRGSSTSGGKKSSVADDREVWRDAVGGRVIGRVEAGDERAAGAALGAEAGQRVGQEVRAQLRGAAAAVGQLGEADLRRAGEVGTSAASADDRAYGASGRSRYLRAGVGSGPVARPGLQNRWRGARRRAVGSTPMRSRHHLLISG